MNRRTKNIISAILLIALAVCLILWKLNVFNLPLSFAGVQWMDGAILVLSMLLVAFSAWTGRNHKVDRFDAALMLAAEAAYLAWLGMNL